MDGAFPNVLYRMSIVGMGPLFMFRTGVPREDPGPSEATSHPGLTCWWDLRRHRTGRPPGRGLFWGDRCEGACAGGRAEGWVQGAFAMGASQLRAVPTSHPPALSQASDRWCGS